MEESNLNAKSPFEPISWAEITLEKETRKVTNIPKSGVDLMDLSKKCKHIFEMSEFLVLKCLKFYYKKITNRS